jgi:hypothetical protein
MQLIFNECNSSHLVGNEGEEEEAGKGVEEEGDGVEEYVFSSYKGEGEVERG